MRWTASISVVLWSARSVLVCVVGTVRCVTLSVVGAWVMVVVTGGKVVCGIVVHFFLRITCVPPRGLPVVPEVSLLHKVLQVVHVHGDREYFCLCLLVLLSALSVRVFTLLLSCSLVCCLLNEKKARRFFGARDHKKKDKGKGEKEETKRSEKGAIDRWADWL